MASFTIAGQNVLRLCRTHGRKISTRTRCFTGTATLSSPSATPTPTSSSSSSSPLASPRKRTQNDHINERLQGIENDIEANPFMNILSTPVRKCHISEKHVPKGMMVQLKAVYLPPGNEPSQEQQQEWLQDDEEEEEEPKEEKSTESRSAGETEDEPASQETSEIDLKALAKSYSWANNLQISVVPSDLLHPSINPPKPGRPIYFLLSRVVVEGYLNDKKWQSLKKPFPNAKVPVRLSEMIEVQLRQRLVQEVDLLQRGNNHTRYSTSSAKQASILCLDSSTYDRLIEQGIPRRLLYDLVHILPHDQQRDQFVHALRTIPNFDAYAQAKGRQLQVPSTTNAISLPYIPILGPLNVALWRARAYSGHPPRPDDDDDIDDFDSPDAHSAASPHRPASSVPTEQL